VVLAVRRSGDFRAGFQPSGFVAVLTQGFSPQRAKALVGDPIRPGL